VSKAISRRIVTFWRRAGKPLTIAGEQDIARAELLFGPPRLIKNLHQTDMNGMSNKLKRVGGKARGAATKLAKKMGGGGGDSA
jgi:hypothetical protein